MKIFHYLHCSKGATVIEYVLIAAGIALAIILAVFAFGGDLGVIFGDLGTATNS